MALLNNIKPTVKSHHGLACRVTISYYKIVIKFNTETNWGLASEF